MGNNYTNGYRCRLWILSNRLNIGFDYYWKQTRDLLYNATLPRLPIFFYAEKLRTY